MDNVNTNFWIEAIGYIGSAIVLISFLMTSVVKLRLINTIGGVIFTTYALIIQSYPTAVMNAALVLINIHFLWKMRHAGRQYDLVKVRYDDQYFQYLISEYRSDINECFPGVEIALDEDPGLSCECYIITCKAMPAGTLVGKRAGEDGDTFEMVLDYALPEFRDFSVGEYLSVRLKDEGISKLTYKGPTVNHMAYLKALNFKEHGGEYEKEL